MSSSRVSHPPASAPAPSRIRRRRLVVVGVIAAVLVVLVAVGVSTAPAVLDALHKQHRESFATRAAASSGWVGVRMPSWIPEGATDIRNLATLDETNSVIRVRTSAKAPVGCEQGPRRSLPVLTSDWAPGLSAPLPDTVWLCGRYEVLAQDDGLLGWFAAEKPGQTPEN